MAEQMRVDKLAEKLARAAGAHGSSYALNIALSSAALAVLTAGVPGIHRLFFQKLAEMDTVELLDAAQHLWKCAAAECSFLEGHLDPLTGWLEDPDEERLASFAGCLRVLAEVDIPAMLGDPLIGGELLGPLYTLLRSRGSKQALGAFFTPMPVLTLMADMTPMPEGARFMEPACGAGGAAVAAARRMRGAGLDPHTCVWHLNDLDAMAVALAGVNAVVHDLGRNVTLTCENALMLAAR